MPEKPVAGHDPAQPVEDARARGVEALRAQATPDAPAAPAAAAAPASDDFDFDAEYNKIPERVRKEYEQRAFSSAYDNFNRALGEKYSDILPLIVEAENDPKLRKALGGLTKKEIREFLFDQALPIYERNNTPPPAAGEGAPPQDFRDSRVDVLEEQFATERGQRAFDRYTAGRNSELVALQNEIGDTLRWQSQDDASYKFVNHLIKVSEDRFERAARTAGVDTSKVTWIADAIDKGVKPPSYREAYQELNEIYNRQAPPTVPATARSGPPERPQAPRTATEGKARAMAELQRAGGFSKLAARGNRR